MALYKATDFNLTNAPEEMVQYAIDNVEDFDNRYLNALRSIGNGRYPLRLSNPTLFDDITEAFLDWCIENDELCILDDGCADVEEVFG